MSSLGYNEKLGTWLKNQPSTDAGANNVQVPGEIEHVIWQTRSKEPSPYETNLAEALLSLFSDDIEDLEAIVTGLNKLGVYSESGDEWTTESYQAEMKRLGF